MEKTIVLIFIKESSRILFMKIVIPSEGILQIYKSVEYFPIGPELSFRKGPCRSIVANSVQPDSTLDSLLH